MTVTKKDSTLHTDTSLPDVKATDVKAAKVEGIKQAIAESAAEQFKATDGIERSDEATPIIDHGVLPIADMLELDPDHLKKRLKGDDKTFAGAISDAKVRGLLETERSGKNRSDVVKVLTDHLGIKTPYEVTSAGPGWTNPVNRDVVKPHTKHKHD